MSTWIEDVWLLLAREIVGCLVWKGRGRRERTFHSFSFCLSPLYLSPLLYPPSPHSSFSRFSRCIHVDIAIDFFCKLVFAWRLFSVSYSYRFFPFFQCKTIQTLVVVFSIAHSARPITSSQYHPWARATTHLTTTR